MNQKRLTWLISVAIVTPMMLLAALNSKASNPSGPGNCIEDGDPQWETIDDAPTGWEMSYESYESTGSPCGKNAFITLIYYVIEEEWEKFESKIQYYTDPIKCPPKTIERRSSKRWVFKSKDFLRHECVKYSGTCIA